MAFVIVDFKNVEDFENSPKVICDTDKYEVESPDIVVKNCYTVINLQ